mgnify:CR=1 FL=1
MDVLKHLMLLTVNLRRGFSLPMNIMDGWNLRMSAWREISLWSEKQHSVDVGFKMAIGPEFKGMAR